MKKEIALKMVEQAFEAGVKKGLIDEDTGKTYFGRIQNFINNGIPEIIGQDVNEHKFYNPKFWKGNWVDGWFEKLTERYHEGSLGGSYIITSAHSFGKLQELVSEQKVWKGIDKVRVGLKGSVESEKGRLHALYCEGIGMSAEEVSSLKPKGGEKEKILATVKEIIPETHKNYETVINMIESQSITGGRITAEANLKVSDIDFGKGTKKYDKDKNNFTRRVPIKSEHHEFYKKLMENKVDGAPLFPILDSNGKQMDKRAAGKYVQEIIGKAARLSGVNYTDENGKQWRFTSHSNRRGYSQELYNGTKYVSKKDITKMIGDYVNLQGSNKEGILSRIEDEKNRLNYYNIKNGKPKKDFSWEQLRRLYVSLHMGHSRIDHLVRYIDTDKPIWNRK